MKALFISLVVPVAMCSLSCMYDKAQGHVRDELSTSDASHELLTPMERNPELALLYTIARKSENEFIVVEAIKKLGAVDEPPSFWSGIANSREYSKVRRRHAVYQLFKRHVRSGTPLSGLAQIMDKPRWVTPRDVRAIGQLGGKIPVRLTFEDSIFAFPVFRELPDMWTIYIKMSGKIERDEFVKALWDQQVGRMIGNHKVLEMGFSPRLEEVYEQKRSGGKGK